MFDDDVHDDDENLDETLTPAQREFAGALGGLSPASTHISRDRLMFKAGVVLGQRSVNRWRGAAAVLVLVNAMWLAIALRPTPGAGEHPIARSTEQPVNVTQPSTPRATTLLAAAWEFEPMPSPSLSPYITARDTLLFKGMSALPAEPNARRTLDAAPPLNVNQLLGPAEQVTHPDSAWAPLRRLFSGEQL